MLDPDVAAELKNSQAVNDALRGILKTRAKRQNHLRGDMPPIPLSSETRRRVDALFDGPAREAAAELLITQCAANLPLWVNPDERGLERIRFAVLKLGNGDLTELRRAVQMAQVDWRDVLVAAGFGDSVRVHESWFP